MAPPVGATCGTLLAMAQFLCPTLIGRDDEVQVLDEALDGLGYGRGTVLVIAGEAGVGKSRLARELTERAVERGTPAVSGRASPASVTSPYRPLTEALLDLLRGRDLPQDHGIDRWIPPLAPILPGVVPAVEHPAPAALRGEAVLQLLRRTAPDGLVVVLEDLHWADLDTVALVEYLAGNVAGQALVLAVTLRPEPASAALEAVNRLRATRGVVPLRLGRLSDEEVGAMIAACGAAVAADRLAWVRQTAEGIPLLVEDLLASPGLPDSIAASVRERLADLPPDARSVIEAAAVLGRHFDWELLPAACGQPAAVVADALARATELVLVVTHAGGFRFRHALTREAVVAAMLPPRHRELACSALRAVEAAHPGLEGGWRDLAADLATRSGDPRRAGRLLLDSGLASLAVGALATAAETLRRAADLLGDDEQRADAELSLMEALSAAGRVDDAAAIANAVAARAGDDSRGRSLRAEAHLRLAEAAVAATRWAMARYELDLATRLAVAPGPEACARLAVVAAEVAIGADDDPAGARRSAEEVLALDGVPPAVRCHAFELVGRSGRLRDLAGAKAAFESALATADEAALPVWRLRALHELGTIDMFDHVGVERLLEARGRAEEMGALPIVATLDLQLAACYTSRWDLDRCDAHADSALEIAERLGLHQVRAKALAMRCGSASMRADTAATERYGALTVGAAPQDDMLIGFCLASRGMAAVMRDETELGLDNYGRGMAVLGRLPNAEPSANRALWPLLLASLGDRRAAAAIQEARQLGVGGFNPNRGQLAYAEAVLAGRAGDSRRAHELSTAADTLLVNSEGWAVLARFLAAGSAAKDRWGEPGRWLEDAQAFFAARGLSALAARARRLRDSLDPNPWAAQGVTDREADVLRLVGRGLANKEIAAELGLSPRTVEKHVENLLRKTGSRTRVELAVRANNT